MHRSIALVIAAALFLSGLSPLLAEDIAPGETTASSLLSRSQWIDCEIADGRLIAKVLRYGQGRVTTQGLAPDGSEIRECLELGCDDAHIHLHYELEQAAGELVLRVLDEREWEVVRRIEAQGEELVFKQPAGGAVTLTLQNKQGRQQFSGASVWHLLLGETLACRRAMVGILQVVKPDWDAEGNLQAVVDTLLQSDADYRPQVAWEQAVANLSAEDYSARQAADRKLREFGRPVLGYLAGLNLAELDAEQRQRIRHIKRELAAEKDDSPRTAASLVQSDVGVWLNLLETNRPEQQERALARVEHLLGRESGIDLSAGAVQLRAQISSAKERYADAQPARYR